jgi:predicted RNA binding protein YcfA (HicA-like mRNA interferase family)
VSERLPQITAQQMIRALERHGFVQSSRSSTSHVKLRHPNGRTTIVAVHKGRDLPRPIVRAILRQTGIAANDLLS